MYALDQILATRCSSLHLQQGKQWPCTVHVVCVEEGGVFSSYSRELANRHLTHLLLRHALSMGREVSVFIDPEERLPPFPLCGEECTPGGVCRVALVIHVTMQADIWCHQEHSGPFALTAAALSLQISVAWEELISLLCHLCVIP